MRRAEANRGVFTFRGDYTPFEVCLIGLRLIVACRGAVKLFVRCRCLLWLEACRGEFRRVEAFEGEARRVPVSKRIEAY